MRTKKKTSTRRVGWSSATREQKSKADWAPISIGDAYNRRLPYHSRIAAEVLFYGHVHRVLKEAGRLMGRPRDEAGPGVAKAQLSPLFTGFPRRLGAHASIGLTGHLEVKRHAGRLFFGAEANAYLTAAALVDGVDVDAEVYQRLVAEIVDAVETRVLLLQQARTTGFEAVETYRIYAAAQVEGELRNVPEIVRAVVLYHDLIPPREALSLHPATLELLGVVEEATVPFLEAAADPAALLDAGLDWVQSIARALEPYLPRARDGDEEEVAGSEGPSEAGAFRFSAGTRSRTRPMTEALGPLDDPPPPALFPEEDALDVLRRALDGMGGATGPRRVMEALNALRGLRRKTGMSRLLEGICAELAEAVGKTLSRAEGWHDDRSDEIRRQARDSPFVEGPIEGSPTEGSEHDVPMGDGSAKGLVFEEVLPPSFDVERLGRVDSDAGPISDALRPLLYPSRKSAVARVQRLSRGALDPARLPLAGVSDAVFQRFTVRQEPDRSGDPVVALIMDGSGSMNPRRMHLMQVITYSWIAVTARSRVQVIAAMHDDGGPGRRGGRSRIRWVYHPRKTPALSSRQAAAAVASLPDKGAGGQSDALSIRFVIDEARALARGRHVYPVMITDCGWCQSFAGSGVGGEEEVRQMLSSVLEDGLGEVSPVLVALSRDEGRSGFEDLIDVVPVPNDELEDCQSVATRLGTFVLQRLREDRGREGRRT